MIMHDRRTNEVKDDKESAVVMHGDESETFCQILKLPLTEEKKEKKEKESEALPERIIFKGENDKLVNCFMVDNNRSILVTIRRVTLLDNNFKIMTTLEAKKEIHNNIINVP